MTRIILSGCNGAMGRVITAAAKTRDDCAVVAGIDLNTQSTAGYPVFAAPALCGAEADVIVDFSHPSALAPLLAFSAEKQIPLVAATTGLGEEVAALIREASKKVPVFHSANMSLGVNLMLELCKTAARVLGQEFDIEIVEKHHNRKLDAPSGTALMLADGISAELSQPPRYEFDRHSKRQKRSRDEIGIHAVRGGTIVGEHDVIFAGRDELLTIRHSASSREIFATGALSAAVFLHGKAPGLYSMKDMI
jgi:4-hydroxy-tetrahydrodipicolinate reductase